MRAPVPAENGRIETGNHLSKDGSVVDESFVGASGATLHLLTTKTCAENSGVSNHLRTLLWEREDREREKRHPRPFRMPHTPPLPRLTSPSNPPPRFPLILVCCLWSGLHYPALRRSHRTAPHLCLEGSWQLAFHGDRLAFLSLSGVWTVELWAELPRSVSTCLELFSRIARNWSDHGDRSPHSLGFPRPSGKAGERRTRTRLAEFCFWLLLYFLICCIILIFLWVYM